MRQKVLGPLRRLMHDAPEHIHLWRFIAGVAYAMEQYERLAVLSPKVDRSDQFYVDQTLSVLENLNTGAEPERDWLRGFFYNAGLMRLDAAWERSLRTILGKKGAGPTLYNFLRADDPALPEYKSSLFGSVREEVNALKHDEKGAPEELRERSNVQRESLWQLLALLELKFVHAV